MGPGPSDVPQRVLDASARQTIGHLDPFFITLMDEIKVMLQQAYKTDNALTMPVSAPGSSGMETCFVNLVDEAYRLPQLNTVYIPEGVDDAAVRRNLLENYQLEIGAGLGVLAGKVWRIGLMGYASREENVELCLRALKETI